MRGRTLVHRLLIVAALLVPLALIASGCTGDPQDTLTHKGDVSSRITNLFMPVFWIAVAVFVFVEGALIWASIRYRRRPDQNQLPAQTHGSTPLEIGWTIAPALLLGGI